MKSIALKAHEERIIDEAKIIDLEEDITLITKRVQKLMINDKFSGRTYNRRNNYKKKVLQEKKEKREKVLRMLFVKSAQSRII